MPLHNESGSKSGQLVLRVVVSDFETSHQLNEANLTARFVDRVTSLVQGGPKALEASDKPKERAPRTGGIEGQTIQLAEYAQARSQQSSVIADGTVMDVRQ
jgi:hypothetical protein